MPAVVAGTAEGSLRFEQENLAHSATISGTIGSTDQRINGSTDQRINGSTDQRINGSTDQRINGSTDQRINGEAR
ncbi:hypothetical protein [Changpingibacter yushuensis]|uniref:hypothetical protein n=1 Tax=Changpingibacter yushuensis TaxID=2758440 RepID=UPI0015F4067B|nr:hypothetical protein [Changpingibacter yushuensis]